MVKGRDRALRLVRAPEVDWIEASGNYVIHHVGRDRYIQRGSLRVLQETLDPPRFIRIHKKVGITWSRSRTVGS